MFLIDTSRNGQPVYNALVNQSLDAYLINDLHLEGARPHLLYQRPGRHHWSLPKRLRRG